MSANEGYIKLSQLQNAIRDTLTQVFPAPLWVCAEIADLKVNYSGHCYLELVEKEQDGSANGVAKAQMRAVIWRTQYARIRDEFEKASGGVLKAGMKILCKVTVSYHELYGLSLQITDIDPSYTLGDMERQKMLTIAQLKKDGVWDMNRQQPIPIVVQRIAVISSPQAAGFQDFCNELRNSNYAFRVVLFEAVMQGTSSEESVVAALDAVAAREEEFDAVAIIRGGGSTSDLGCFNSYRLALNVAQFPLPILSGIGHDKDTSIVDMVANTQLKTPTAVAGWLYERALQFEGALDYAAEQLHRLCIDSTRGEALRLERMRSLLMELPQNALNARRTALAVTAERIATSAEEALRRQRERLASLAEIARSRSPHEILRLGFAVARTGGHAVNSVGEIAVGSLLEIELSDGTVTAKTV